MFAFTLLRYLRVNFLQYINPSIIVCFPNSSVGLHPDAHFCVREICVYTNNADYIKYRIKKSEQFLSSSIIVCLSKYSPTRSPFWRRYTFLRVRLRNHRFLPHPQKNWSPLRTVFTSFYNQHSILSQNSPQKKVEQLFHLFNSYSIVFFPIPYQSNKSLFLRRHAIHIDQECV